ncbi:hypothetical protein Gohar_017587 [Gossypium harknessii]|uniref:Uncharacterized protein n=1 Tax=Gossypium harknessii TaxID=34285 RepID=A0A7J9G7Q6_9ROSI|nr:hypothetical protein [Gossypium harknessii]
MRTRPSTLLLHFFPNFQLGPNFSHPLHWSIPPHLCTFLHPSTKAMPCEFLPANLRLLATSPISMTPPSGIGFHFRFKNKEAERRTSLGLSGTRHLSSWGPGLATSLGKCT